MCERANRSKPVNHSCNITYQADVLEKHIQEWTGHRSLKGGLIEGSVTTWAYYHSPEVGFFIPSIFQKFSWEHYLTELSQSHNDVKWLPTSAAMNFNFQLRSDRMHHQLQVVSATSQCRRSGPQLWSCSEYRTALKLDVDLDHVCIHDEWNFNNHQGQGSPLVRE